MAGPFKLKSGNSPLFKTMGSSSPLEHDIIKKQKTKYDKEGNIIKQRTKYVKHKHDEEGEQVKEDTPKVEPKPKDEKKGKEGKEGAEGKKSKLPPASEWPKPHTQERIDFYKDHNLKLDDTTTLPKEEKKKDDTGGMRRDIRDRLTDRLRDRLFDNTERDRLERKVK